MEFKDAAELMVLDCKSRQLSPYTIRFYRQCASSVFKIIGPKKINAFCALDIRRVLTAVPPRSAPHHYRALKRLFNFLMDEEVIATNPMAKIRCPKSEQRVVELLTPIEIQKCYKAARHQRGYMGLRDSVIFATLVATGLRRAELCNLRDEDVRLDESMLLVNGKGRKQRFVPMHHDLKKLLAHYKYARDDTKAGRKKVCNYFFRSRHGGALLPDNLTLTMTRLGNTAGVHLHAHRLRHTFATSFMSNDGADILTLQAICGWSQLAMTQRYAKPSMAKMQRSMDSLSPVSQLK